MADFFSVYASEAGPLLRYVKRLGVRDAADVVHDAFVEAFRWRERVDTSRSVRGWLHGIAYRLVLARRATAREVRRTEDGTEVPDDAASAPEVPGARQRRRLLRAALETLPDSQRDVFVWYYLEELPLALLAQQSGTSEHTLRRRLRLAGEKVESFFQGAAHA